MLFFNLVTFCLFGYLLASNLPTSVKPKATPGPHNPTTHRPSVPTKGTTAGKIKATQRPNGLTTKIPFPDQPLSVTVLQISDTWAQFNLSSQSNLLNNSQINDISVTYRIDSKKIKSNVQHYPRDSILYSATQPFNDILTITDLKPGYNYRFRFSAINVKKQVGPPSNEVSVLTLPPTPNIQISHPSSPANKIVVQWSENDAGSEDFFILTLFKTSNPSSGFTVNITNSYGHSFSIDDLTQGETYQLTLTSHNPTGYSKLVNVKYPLD